MRLQLPAKVQVVRLGVEGALGLEAGTGMYFLQRDLECSFPFILDTSLGGILIVFCSIPCLDTSTIFRPSVESAQCIPYASYLTLRTPSTGD